MRYTFEQVKESFEKEGYKLLSKEYKNSKVKLDYICLSGHNHSITFHKWIQGQRCPYCSGRPIYTIEDIKKIFLKEGFEVLTDRYINSKSKFNVKCPNGHVIKTSYANFVLKGNRCPVCSGKSKPELKTIRKEAEKRGYKLISDEYKNCESLLEFLCPSGHQYFATWSSFRRGHGCGYCFGRYKHNTASVSELVSKDSYTLLNEYSSVHETLELECPKGHIYRVSLANWNSKNYRCPKCNELGTRTSKAESDLSYFLKNVLNQEIINNDRELCKPKEIDIIIPDHKLAIEYCGLYWHSELKGKNRKYHLNKLNVCAKAGYRLITIFEDEWETKTDIVKSRLKAIIKNTFCTKIFARKCEVKEIKTKQAKKFCEENHLQGYGAGSSVKLGLFYQDGLVSVMTFSKPSVAKGHKKAKEGVWELHRFCSKLNTQVIGGASKLLKYFEKNFKWTDIFSYADRRWSNGNLYNKLGFVFDKATLSNYWYVKKLNRVHRFALRKAPYEPKEVSEWELRKAQGYNRIWDCGSLKYVKHND